MIGILPEGTSYNIDWEAFRVEAAKDILCASISNKTSYDSLYEVHHAVEMADELIKTLRDGKE